MPDKVVVPNVMILDRARLTSSLTIRARAHALVRAAGAWMLTVGAGGMASSLPAQTDYYNTDAGRPIQVEDAYSMERYAFELQLAPILLERRSGGIYNWGLEPEIAYGVLPRTQLEIGLPFVFIDAGPLGRRSGLAGIDVSMLHNLNAETQSLPAFGIAAHVLIPAGGLAADETYLSAKGIVTRTYSWARLHVNAQYTFGEDLTETTGTDAVDATAGSTALDLSRWLAGIAVDRTFPLRSLLVTGELFASQALHDDADVEWNVGAGIRYQWTPRLAFDAGIGRRLTGDDRSWFVTFGLAKAFAIAALMPGR
jgi:hypothetical protein